MNLHEMLADIKIVAITCGQFGDTGKGKFVDLLAQWADIIARGTGGDNAGHTICLNGQDYIFHLVPSGILYDSYGKINIIGNGTAVYPKTLLQELSLLTTKGLGFNNLRLAWNAKLTLPQHIIIDRLKELKGQGGKIGTTGKGIGPVYADHVARLGLVVGDLLNKDQFVRKLRRNLEDKQKIFAHCDRQALEFIMNHEHLDHGLYYDSRQFINQEAIIEQYLEYGQELTELIADTDSQLRRARGSSNILLEGAQGLLLSVDYGTYPFVTSSDCSPSGLAKGVGLRESDIGLSLGIIKGFYMTRVGCGPFPTELGGTKSEAWCNNGSTNQEQEQIMFVEPNINDQDEFNQGVAMRLVGNEYGATTKRPRRTGWLDLPLLRYAVACGLTDIIMTKLDVLNEVEVIKLCHHYIYRGPDYSLGETQLKSGDLLMEAIPLAEVLQHCEPVYAFMPGWLKSLGDFDKYQDLPDELKNIVDYVAQQTGINPRILSIGPQREETIFV